ncbi:MAG: ABC transporter ATP-binding protein, partial [Clostridia bacterium]|nr:ABC transporter ATP-binding protein [Clostridia bacterium]
MSAVMQRLSRFLGEIPLPERKSERFSYREEDAVEKPFDARQLWRLLSYVAPYRRRVAWALAFTLVASGTRLALPFILGLAIDRAIAPGRLTALDRYAAGYLALQLVYWVASYVRIRLTNRMGQDVLRDLRAQLFGHIQALSFEFFDGRPAGKVLVRVIND